MERRILMDTKDDTRPGGGGRWSAGWLAWGAALAVGALASFWVDEALWRSLMTLGALILVVLGKLPPVAPSTSSQNRTRLLLLLALVCVAQATASDLWRFGTSSWVRVENVYPDYLGSKYFSELGYDDLHVAALAADAQDGGYWQRIAMVWSPRRSMKVSRASTAAAYDPSLQFDPKRWQDFQRDVRALQAHRSPEAWSEVFHRRVEDASPLRIAVLRVLTQLPTDVWALKLLCSLDLLLLFWAIRQIGKTFGGRALAAALLLFVLTPVHGSGIVGGLLRYDGFCALALGLCGLRRNRPWAAAACLAYAAGIRLFPAILVISMMIPWARRFVAEGRCLPRDRRLALALVVSAFAALGISAWAGGGLDTWRRFATEIVEDHGSHRFEQGQLSLAHGFTRDIRNLDFTRPGLEGRRNLFGQQKTLYQASSILLLGLWGAAVWRRNRVDALLLGMVPLFVLWSGSAHDWACLALLPLLARPGPPGRRRGRLLLASQLAMLAMLGLAQLRGFSGFSLFGFFDVLLGLFWLLLVIVYLLSDLEVWRRRRPLKAVHRSRALAAIFFVGLFLLLCWLRLPDPEDPIRDVDEAVSALIAASWLDGGVPYRDAIDQRGPVTYLVYAAVFAVAGVYDMVAIQWALLLWVLACCFLVFLLGRSLRCGVEGAATGYLAALFLAIGSVTFKRGQMLAFQPSGRCCCSTRWPWCWSGAPCKGPPQIAQSPRILGPWSLRESASPWAFSASSPGSSTRAPPGCSYCSGGIPEGCSSIEARSRQPPGWPPVSLQPSGLPPPTSGPAGRWGTSSSTSGPTTSSTTPQWCQRPIASPLSTPWPIGAITSPRTLCCW